MIRPFIRAVLAVPVAAAILVAVAGPSVAGPVIPDGGGGGDIPKLSFDDCYIVTVYTPNPEDPAVEVCPPTV